MVKLSFFGIGEGEPTEILSGKRRAVTYMAFLTFVLIVAAMDADDWVTGGVEFDIGGALGTEDLQSLNPRMKDLCGMSGIDLVEVAAELEAKREAAIAAGLEAPPMLGVTIAPKFHLGLTRYTQGGTTYQRYSQAAVERDCYMALSDEIDNINAGTKINNSWWYGTAPFNMLTFNATFGLLGFAAFLQSAIYFLFVCIAYDAPYIATNAKTPLVIRFTSLLVVFFIAVPMLYFGTSGMKESFCNAFDPDTRFNGTFCGYQTGFNLGIASAVFAAAQVLLLWLWVPKDVVAGRYEFSSKGATGFEPVGASSGTSSESAATAPSSAGAYQDFGSSTM